MGNRHIHIFLDWPLLGKVGKGLIFLHLLGVYGSEFLGAPSFLYLAKIFEEKIMTMTRKL